MQKVLPLHLSSYSRLEDFVVMGLRLGSGVMLDRQFTAPEYFVV
jgi:hypothetical protein